jgi:DNA polymerase I-like protein with 3'-5' exonuclease and polymerase domains
MLVLDFETHPITDREPHPIPVGLAIKDRKGSRYVRGNLGKLKQALLDALDGRTGPIVMHNGVGFDIQIAYKHLGVDLHRWQRHLVDTLVLAFLDDPYRRLALKTLANALLGIPPDEQTALRAWIIANVAEAKRAPKQWGAWIYRAPSELVEPYAIGDVERTARLYALLAKRVRLDGMMPAHDRIIRASRVLHENERMGIRVDAAGLVSDAETYSTVLDRTDAAIRRYLRAPNLDVDQDQPLGHAIEKATGTRLPRTEKTDQFQTNKGAIAALSDSKLSGLLLYRSALAQNLRTFLLPWRDMAGNDGRIRTHWNLVAGSGSWGGGAKTGRLSSEPNFQNIPSTERADELIARLHALKWRALSNLWGASPPLPRMRRYVLPDDDESVIIGRDYSQQELRLLAEFEGEDLLDLYRRFPEADLHKFVGDMLREVTEVELPRKTIKVLNFCQIYGGGPPAIAAQGDMSLDEATRCRDLYFSAMPSVRETMRRHEHMARTGGVTTIGGRIYEAERVVSDKGVMRDFAYRCFNYRIQGSAADQMTEALANIGPRIQGRFLLTVHDELVFSAKKQRAKDALRELDRVMVDTAKTFKLRVPFRTEGYIGPNWADVVKDKTL